MGDGGKSDYVSPGGPPIPVSKIPDLIPTTLTDFGSSGKSKTSSSSSESSSGSSGGSGGGGGGAVGGAIGAGGGSVDVGDPDEDTEDGEDGEADDEEPADDPTLPETPEVDNPDPEEPDEPEQDDREEDDEDEEDDEHQAMMVIQSDPWDNMGWGLEPIRLRIKEEFRDQVGIYDDIAPVREFSEPRAMKERWECDSRRHKMPINTSVWDDDPPESAELANRAFMAARHQGLGRAAKYLRRLRVATIVEGINIEDEDVLLELAEEVGLDRTKLQEDWADIEPKTTASNPEIPKTFVHTDGETMEYTGYIHIDDLKMFFEQAGLEEEDPQPLRGFVREHGPVTANEVMFVYGHDRKEEAVEELQGTNGIMPVEFGYTTFWARAQ